MSMFLRTSLQKASIRLRSVMLFLQAHYRSPLSFTWESLQASNEALQSTLEIVMPQILLDVKRSQYTNRRIKAHTRNLLHDDLGTPQALAYLWETLRDEDIIAKEKRAIIEAAEPILRTVTSPSA